MLVFPPLGPQEVVVMDKVFIVIVGPPPSGLDDLAD